MAFPRNALFMASVALAACSPQGNADDKASEPAQAGSLAAQPDHADGAATPTDPAAKQTVVMTRNLKPDAIKTGKPLPRKRIVLKRGQRIDVLDNEGMTSFVGPVTIGPDGQTVSGGGGQEDVLGFGGPRDPIVHLGGVRIESPRASSPAPRPPPPPVVPLPPSGPPK
jgi:hypothetical protein